MRRAGNSLPFAAGAGDLKEVRKLLSNKERRGFFLTQRKGKAGLAGLAAAASYGHKDVVEELLNYGADVNMRDSLGSTAAAWAARGGHLDVLRLLLDTGAVRDMNQVLEKAVTRNQVEAVRVLMSYGMDVNSFSRGRSMASHAVLMGNYEMVQFLIEEGADLRLADVQGRSPLMHAGHKNNLEIVRLILQNASLDQRTLDAALGGSAVRGSKEILSELIYYGANPNSRNRQGRTPLSRASGSGFLEVMHLLIKAGADVNLADDRGKTPLMYSAGYNYVQAAALLLDNMPSSTDLNMRDEVGRTALSWACGNGATEAVMLLLNRGAADLPDVYGACSLSFAAGFGNKRVCELLLAMGGNATQADEQGATPLSRAADCGNAECVQLLLEHGASQAATDLSARSPLILAVRRGHVECVRLLLAQGTEVINFQDDEGRTALFHAVIEGYEEIVNMLLDHGADFSIPDLEGETVMHVCAARGYTSITGTFLERSPTLVSTPNDDGCLPIEFAASSRVRHMLKKIT